MIHLSTGKSTLLMMRGLSIRYFSFRPYFYLYFFCLVADQHTFHIGRIVLLRTITTRSHTIPHFLSRSLFQPKQILFLLSSHGEV